MVQAMDRYRFSHVNLLAKKCEGHRAGTWQR
jgi:hypothetical protein